MGIEIAINITPQETRVAVLENKVVTELYVDRAKKKDFVGDVYKGKVVKVLPGMQAAFIDIGLDRAAFVHVSDLSVGTEPGDVLVDNDEDDKHWQGTMGKLFQLSSPSQMYLNLGLNFSLYSEEEEKQLQLMVEGLYFGISFAF